MRKSKANNSEHGYIQLSIFDFLNEEPEVQPQIQEAPKPKVFKSGMKWLLPNGVTLTFYWYQNRNATLWVKKDDIEACLDCFHNWTSKAKGVEYNEITTSQKIAIPVYKFAGFFLWMAALLGALSYLNDCDNKLYMRMSKGGRFFMGLILPAAHVIPVIVISLISFIICGAEFSVVHVLVYSIVSILLAFLIASVVAALPMHAKRSSIFAAVLPTYLILSFLFGGVLMNLSVYSPVLRTVSMLFPPYFF